MPMLQERLKALRYEYDETQQAVADSLGVKRATYGAYEKGAIFPPYDKIKKLAEHFNVSVEYLMGETEFRARETPAEPPAAPVSFNINDVMRMLIERLNDKAAPVHVDFVSLDAVSRDMLANALRNCLNMGEMIAKSNNNRNG